MSLTWEWIFPPCGERQTICAWSRFLSTDWQADWLSCSWERQQSSCLIGSFLLLVFISTCRFWHHCYGKAKWRYVIWRTLHVQINIHVCPDRNCKNQTCFIQLLFCERSKVSAGDQASAGSMILKIRITCLPVFVFVFLFFLLFKMDKIFFHCRVAQSTLTHSALITPLSLSLFHKHIDNRPICD